MAHRLFLLLLFIAALSGCQPKLEDQLLGEWTTRVYMDPQQFAAMSEDPLPPGLSMEMTLSGTSVFHRGNKYTDNGELTLRINNNGQEIPLRFALKDAGTWEIHDNVLVQTSSDAQLTPLDQTSRQMLAQSPEFAAAFTPVQGESVSMEVVTSQENIIDLKMLETPHLSFTLRRKQ